MADCVYNVLSVQPMSEGPLSDSESEGSRGRTFHRSISMGTNGAPWSRREGDGRVIMMRKRNNSSGETASGKCVEQIEMVILFF
jgi:E3 ubiquitin-protein ligase MYCBP2